MNAAEFHKEVPKMPCPKCGKKHTREVGSYITCACGTPLRLYVPIFAVNAQPYGWKWVLNQENTDA